MWVVNDLMIALNKEFKSPLLGHFNAVQIDSRAVKHNDIFIGIKGPHHDGSTFSKQAIENGAALCIVSFIPDNCNNFQNHLDYELLQYRMD